MGKWLEVLTERPADDEPYLETKPEIIINEIAPNPLIGCAKLIAHKYKDELPALYQIRPHSTAYSNESLCLNSQEAKLVLDEFRRIRNVADHKDFINGISAERVQELWEEYNWNNEINEWLDKIEESLQLASEKGYWVRILL